MDQHHHDYPYTNVKDHRGGADTLTIVFSAVSTGLAVLAFLIRIYARTLGERSWEKDDYACIVAMMFSIAFIVQVLADPVNSIDQDKATVVDVYAAIVKKALYSSTITFCGIFASKLSLFLLFLRLFWPNRNFRYQVYVGIAFSALFTVSALVVVLASGTPRSGESWTSPNLFVRYERDTALAIAQGVVNLVLDFYLLYLPIPQIWTLHLEKKKRLGLMVVFLTGFVACISSCIGLIYRIKLYENVDDLWAGEMINIFNVVDINVAIACACTPGLAGVIRHLASRSALLSLHSPDPENLTAASHRSRRYRSSRRSKPLVPNVSFVEPGRSVRTHIRRNSGAEAAQWTLAAAEAGAIVQSFELTITSSTHVASRGEEEV